jgi:hypothetical protein
MIRIHIASEYTKTPGARYQRDGDFSGEEFRTRYLEPLFIGNNEDIIEINLDGVEGYSTAFLEEAFGGLARLIDKEKILARVKFVSEEEPLLINEIIEYINKAR